MGLTTLRWRKTGQVPRRSVVVDCQQKNCVISGPCPPAGLLDKTAKLFSGVPAAMHLVGESSPKEKH
jgi:hypothetical protein